MERIAVLCGFYVLVIFSTGLSAYIQTQQNVLAAAGQHVSLSCQLSQPEDVEEVEWRKILSDGETSLSSFNKLLGRKVNPEFEERMEFKFDGFHGCSVGLKVTEQDEGCYRCVFKTNPEGLLTNRTCLWIYELHQPVLRVRDSKSPGESLVSCSATGRPAPTVTLTATRPGLLSQYKTTSVQNNNTVSITTTAVLSGFHDDSTQVGCAVRVLSGPQMEVNQRVPGRLRELFHSFVPFVSFKEVLPWIVLFLVCAAVLIIICTFLSKLIWKCTCHFVDKIFEEPEV